MDGKSAGSDSQDSVWARKSANFDAYWMSNLLFALRGELELSVGQITALKPLFKKTWDVGSSERRVEDNARRIRESQ